MDVYEFNDICYEPDEEFYDVLKVKIETGYVELVYEEFEVELSVV